MTGLTVENLSVAFRSDAGTIPVLRDLSFAIRPGSMLGLVGESGSGKSTAAFALMGLLPSNAQVLSGSASLGETRIDLTRPDQVAPLRGRQMAMIFQDPLLSLNPVFTILAHLTEAMRRREPTLGRKEWAERAEAALAKVGMSYPNQRLRQYPHELSGGMRQRVVIAMALLAKPDVLIADEPTTALDVTVEAQVMAAIRILRDEIGCSVLLITHSLGLVMQHCDDLAVLYAGERVEAGSVAEVRQNPAHPYARMLLDCEVSLDAARTARAIDNRFEVIGGELPDLRHLPPGCIFRPRCDVAFAACAVEAPGDRLAGGAASDHIARCLHLPVGQA